MGLLNSFLSGALGNGLINVLPRVEQREQSLAAEARRRAENLQDEQRRRDNLLGDRASDRQYQEERAQALYTQQQRLASDKVAAERAALEGTGNALAVARGAGTPEEVAAIRRGNNPFASETGDQDAGGNPIMQVDQERFLAAAKIINQAVADVSLKGAADDVEKAATTRRQNEILARATAPGATPEDIQQARRFGLLGRITSLGSGQYVDPEGVVQQTPVSNSIVGANEARAEASRAGAAAAGARAARDQSEPTGNARLRTLELASARADRLVQSLGEQLSKATRQKDRDRLQQELEGARAAASAAAAKVENFGQPATAPSPLEQARAEAVSSGQEVNFDIGGRRGTLEGGTGRERAAGAPQVDREAALTQARQVLAKKPQLRDEVIRRLKAAGIDPRGL